MFTVAHTPSAPLTSQELNEANATVARYGHHHDSVERSTPIDRDLMLAKLLSKKARHLH